MKTSLINLLFFALFNAILISCDDKTDIEFPVVTYYSPADNTSFQVFDTILVHANISDNSSIKSAEIYLANSNYVPVLPSYPIEISGNPQVVNFYYPLDDISLESGDYKICIKVSDGENVKYKYKNVKISNFQRIFSGLAVFVESGNQITWVDLNEFFVEEESTNYQMNFGGATFDISGELLYFSGLTHGNIYSIYERERQIIMSKVIASTGDGWPVIVGLDPAKNGAFIHYYSSKTEFYNTKSILKSTINFTGGCYCKKMKINYVDDGIDDFLIAHLVKPTNASYHELGLFDPDFFNKKYNYVFNSEPLFYQQFENQLFVFLKNSGTYVARLYNIPTSSYFEDGGFPTSGFKSGCHLDQSQVLLLFENKAIVYDVISGISYDVTVLSGYDRVEYSKDANLYFAIKDEQIDVYNQSYTLVKTLGFDGKVLDLEFIIERDLP